MAMEYSLGQRIREIRTEAKLTQAEFGEKVAVLQDTVSLWENGKSAPSAEYLAAICRIFRVSADYLLGLKEF